MFLISVEMLAGVSSLVAGIDEHNSYTVQVTWCLFQDFMHAILLNKLPG